MKLKNPLLKMLYLEVSGYECQNGHRFSEDCYQNGWLFDIEAATDFHPATSIFNLNYYCCSLCYLQLKLAQLTKINICHHHQLLELFFTFTIQYGFHILRDFSVGFKPLTCYQLFKTAKRLCSGGLLFTELLTSILLSFTRHTRRVINMTRFYFIEIGRLTKKIDSTKVISLGPLQVRYRRLSTSI